MKIKSVVTIFILLIYSCGSKKAAINKEELTKEVHSYVSKVDTNITLKKEVTEGALTDMEGFKDIGTFKYTVYFDETTNELFKIKNVEITDTTITETYYFQDNDLIYASSISDTETQKIYLKKGNVVFENDMTIDEKKLFLDKAKRFQKEFEKSH